MTKQTFLSLASGIGGFELAAQLATANYEPIAFCEKDPDCQKLLAKRFPNVPIFPDLKKLTATDLASCGIFPDGCVAGLPCQPFSQAGRKKGAADDRNLFPEFLRLLRAIRFQWAIIENVPGLLSIDSGRVFRDLLWQISQIGGYDVRWQTLSCSQIGGCHARERLWIIIDSHSYKKRCWNGEFSNKKNAILC